MPQRIKVLYFTFVNLDRPDNGGVLVCRNHVRRMAQDPRLIVTLCNIGAIGRVSETQAFASSIGVPLHFIPFQQNPPQPQPRWPFFLELDALGQSHIDKIALDLVNQIKPDVVVVDYLFSALFVRSLFSAPIRRVMITLNRELDFYKELKRIRGLPADPSDERLSEFERSIYQSCDAVVTLTTRDIPANVEDKARVIPPLFDPALDERWSYVGTGKVLFIGNINHYPNFMAVDWLATRLAPMLETMPDKVDIEIIGAAADNIPAVWRRRNVVFLGVGDASLVTKKLVASDLFIAPIANAFGSKIKLLDCLSRGTPFVATQEAMSGLAFLQDVPRIRLDQPREAAEIVRTLLQDATSLTSLSHRFSQQLMEALKAQEGIWGDLFEQVIDDELPPTESPEPSNTGGHDPKNQSTWGKVGRNEPCPCGSGKKYKNCHHRQT